MIFWFFATFFAVVVALAVYAWRQERRRREALRAWAGRHGWTFIEKDRHDRPVRYEGHEPFGLGHSRYAHNILSTHMEGVRVEVFDYHYAVTRSSGKSQHTEHHHFQVATLPMPLSSPGLTIRDEHIGHKLFDALGGEDIDFESHEFSKQFWVRAPDRRFAYDVIHPGTMEFLLENRGWVWQWRGRTLLLHRKGKLTPDRIEPMVRLVLRFHGLVPRHRLADTVTIRGD